MPRRQWMHGWLLMLWLTVGCGPSDPAVELISAAKATDEQSEPPASADEPDEHAAPMGDRPMLQQPPPRGLLEQTAQPPLLMNNDGDAIEASAEQWNIPLRTLRAHLQPVEYPMPPELDAARQVRVFTMADLQQSIASNTVIEVVGRLVATEEDLVTISEGVHDLIIRFADDAKIEYVGGQSWSGLFRIMPTARRIRFESPRLIGMKDTADTCAGIEFVWDDSRIVAQDIAIVDGTFVGLNYAIQAHNGCRRLLVQNCLGRGLIDYFIYGAKTMEDVTIDGCTVQGVRANHVIRLFDANRVNIFRNDLSVDSVQDGQMKRTIWLLTGSNVTIAGNRTRDGRVTIGPNPVFSDSGPDDRVGHVNVVFNRITHTHTNTPIELLSGAHDVFLTGNVIDTFTDAWLGIGGWNEHRRPISNIRWTNGTVLNDVVVAGREGVAINEHYAGQDDIRAVTIAAAESADGQPASPSTPAD